MSPHNRNTYRIANNSQRGRARGAGACGRGDGGGRDDMHRLQMRTGSGGGSMTRCMSRWMLAVVTAMVPGRQVADFGAIGTIERFEDEPSPVTASGSDGISDGGMRR